MSETVIIPFFDVEVSVNTLIGLALLLIIFFSFFSVSFAMNMGESTDPSDGCNKRDPEDTDGGGTNKSSWASGLGFGDPTKDSNPVKGAKSGDEDSYFW